jgi:outer membrane lipoprotein
MAIPIDVDEVTPMRHFPLLVLLLLVTACASAPSFNTVGVDRSLTPQGVAATPQPATGKSVQWGGVIVSTTNLKGSTQIEVLAYPLDADGRPKTDGTAQGRFILERTGYLEPASYAEGRQVTAVGTLTRTQTGRVGEADYTYPVISARQLYLWPKGQGRDGTSTFFNIGVGGGSGGNWGSGVGVGVGF